MGGSMGNSVGGGLAMSLEGQAGFSPSEFMAGTPPNWSDPSMAQVEQNFPLVNLLRARLVLDCEHVFYSSSASALDMCVAGHGG